MNELPEIVYLYIDVILGLLVISIIYGLILGIAILIQKMRNRKKDGNG
jgi:hypothetical protein